MTTTDTLIPATADGSVSFRLWLRELFTLNLSPLEYATFGEYAANTTIRSLRIALLLPLLLVVVMEYLTPLAVDTSLPHQQVMFQSRVIIALVCITGFCQTWVRRFSMQVRLDQLMVLLVAGFGLLYGSIARNGDISAIIEAIRTVHQGGTYLSEDVRLGFEQKALNGEISPLEQLSGQEYRVMLLLIQGMRNVDIAAQLDIGKTTVGTYVDRIFRKLGVASVAGLVRLASLHGVEPM